MAFGKQIFYQDAHDPGEGNNRYWAEDINELIMALQSNYVVSGCGVSVGAETNLGVSGNHLAVAGGTAFVNGAVRTVSSANIDLSTAFAAMTTGEARFILVYLNSSGVIATKSGDITTETNQLPEVSNTGWTDDNTTPLAWIYIKADDSTMSANQIIKQQIYAPEGQYINGFSYLDGNVDIYAPDQVRIYDPDNSDALLFDFDTTNRTLDIGSATDSVATNVFGDLDLNGNNLTMGDGNIYTEDNTVPLVVASGVNGVGIGGNIVIYGDSHASTPNDIRFRQNVTDVLRYDHSATKWLLGSGIDLDLNNNDIVGLNNILEGVSDGGMVISGDTGTGAGANLTLYGGSHATSPFDIRFRQGTTNVLLYDHSATKWLLGSGIDLDLNGNNLDNVGSISASGTYIGFSNPTNGRTMIPASDSNYDLGNGSRYWREIFYDTLTASSSIDKKENVSYQVENMGDLIYKLNPVTYRRKKSIQGRFGFILEDIEELAENDQRFKYFMNYEEEDGELGKVNGLDMNAFLPGIILAMKDLNTRVSQLESR